MSTKCCGRGGESCTSGPEFKSQQQGKKLSMATHTEL